MNEYLKKILGNMENITIIDRYNSNIFTTYGNDIEKINADKKFVIDLLKYLKIKFNKTIPLKYLKKKIHKYNNRYNKLPTMKELENVRNENDIFSGEELKDIFSGEELKDIPKERLVFIEKIDDTYNGFDVMHLRKYLFENKKEIYINPLTTNKISEYDMNKILKIDIRSINYFS
jgi:hypothetical protein